MDSARLVLDKVHYGSCARLPFLLSGSALRGHHELQRQVVGLPFEASEGFTKRRQRKRATKKRSHVNRRDETEKGEKNSPKLPLSLLSPPSTNNRRTTPRPPTRRVSSEHGTRSRWRGTAQSPQRAQQGQGQGGQQSRRRESATRSRRRRQEQEARMASLPESLLTCLRSPRARRRAKERS